MDAWMHEWACKQPNSLARRRAYSQRMQLRCFISNAPTSHQLSEYLEYSHLLLSAYIEQEQNSSAEDLSAETTLTCTSIVLERICSSRCRRFVRSCVCTYVPTSVNRQPYASVLCCIRIMQSLED
mmetsp:Transcript_5785/g.15683  ORF Transcript_5785/g.15683 Transcript_5785/m.15683 type:complete len:125 (-) Transcript_5785:1755-2129(-)